MEKPSTARIALKWGLILGIVSIIYTTIAFMTGLWKNNSLNFIVSSLISIGGLVLAIREFKSNNQNYLSIGQGTGLGTLVSVISGMLSVLWSNLIYVKFIDPTFQEKQIENIREQYEQMGMSDEIIEKSIERIQDWNGSGLSFLVAIIFIAIIGAVLSLIISAIMRKNKPEIEF